MVSDVVSKLVSNAFTRSHRLQRLVRIEEVYLAARVEDSKVHLGVLRRLISPVPDAKERLRTLAAHPVHRALVQLAVDYIDAAH